MLWFRAQPSEWFHRPKPISKSVARWWLQVGVSSSERSPQLSSPSHSWWGCTQALFWQW